MTLRFAIDQMRLTFAAMAALALVCLDLPAGADQTFEDAWPRRTWTLNGRWKFQADDSVAFFQKDFNDSKWRTLEIPEEGNPTKYRLKRVVWYRKTFRVPNGERFHYLRLGRVLDKAEVWLNGRKLLNPQYVRPLMEAQYGSYADLWETEWNAMFDISAHLDSYGLNALAIRVMDLQPDESAAVRKCYSAVCDGKAGILGDIELVGLPDRAISSIKRQSSILALSPFAQRNSFDIRVIQTDLEPVEAEVGFTIFDPDGKKVFAQKQPVKLTHYGDVLRFVWDAQPRFGSFRAAADLLVDGKVADHLESLFEGQAVQVVKGRLLVNGAPFSVKAVHGIPGLLIAGGKGEVQYDWIKDDMTNLLGTGANALHIPNPSREMVKEAFRNGMMVIPQLDLQGAEKAVAGLSELPGILMWDIAGLTEDNLATYRKKVELLDPYGRPLMVGETLPEKAILKSEILSLDSSKFDAADCRVGAASSGGPGLKVAMGGWKGEAKEFDEGSFDLKMREFWRDCVQSPGLSGGSVAEIADISGSANGATLRRASSPSWSQQKVSGLEGLYEEIGIAWLEKSPGLWSVWVENRAAYPLQDMSLRLDGASEGAESKIGNVAINSAGNASLSMKEAKTLVIQYETHNGLRRKRIVDLGQPLKRDRLFSFVEGGLSAGRSETVKLEIRIANGYREARTLAVEIASPAGIVFEPARVETKLEAGAEDRFTVWATIPRDAAPGPALIQAIAKPVGAAGTAFRAMNSIEILP